MNILALGQERFRIHDLKYDRSYLVGVVELFPLKDPDQQAVLRGIARLRPLIVQYLEILKEVGQIQFDSSQLPDDTATIAYLSAVLLQAPASQKQTLLAAEHTSGMLTDLRIMYRRELALLNFMKEHNADETQKGPFSLN
jgi:Lon protease-like protein